MASTSQRVASKQKQRINVRQRLPSNMENRVILGGAYRIKKYLGHGGFAACYEAEACDIDNDTKTKKFAVKCIPTKDISDFRRSLISEEIDYQRRLTESGSKNILKLVDHGVDENDEITYIVTELCEGGDLFRYVTRHSLSGKDEKIKRIFLQILDGVKEMHAQGIYHRDLKPENIFMRKDKTIAIGDFGLASDQKMMYEASGAGTLSYLSPEALGGLHVHMHQYSLAHNDMWALGVILLNLVTGNICWKRARLGDGRESEIFDFYYSIRWSLEMKMMQWAKNKMRGKNPGPFPTARVFTHFFDITDEADQLLQDIFSLHPPLRVNVNDLINRIKNVSSFGTGKKTPRVMGGTNAGERYVEAITSATSVFTDSAETVYSAATPPSRIESTVATDHAAHRELSTPQPQPAPRIDSSSDGESEDDSNGPATPETHAETKGVAVEQDIEEMDLGDPKARLWTDQVDDWMPTEPKTNRPANVADFGLVQIDMDGMHAF